MENLLLLTDFSEDSTHAALYAIQLFGTEHTRYTAVHAYMDPYMTDPMMPMPTLAPGTVRIAEEGLKEWTARLQEITGIGGIQDHLGLGWPAQVANDLVLETHPNLVVLGRSGKGGSSLFGSSAVDVMKRSRTPVLVVPSGAALSKPGKILLVDDFEDTWIPDMALLRTIAEQASSKVIVAQIVPEVVGGTRQATKTEYEGALKDIPHTFMTARGDNPVDGIFKLMIKEGADMLVVLHRHRDMIARFLHPSTTKQLVKHGDRPILVLEQKDPL